ncbi:aminotransferase class III-fold pyridoxal phosphate-dependent enzyme [Thalassomonas actiniarum]|uniref:Aspartate aminotransferase family protein n=1 Tax=Thalassomonas actiniarum TaxID=485447 RepID=A0AAE9YR78_9GAMM|nr:aminotransferase class III-fold pyridoxal phosphate-dependent enzyme [Thalassomonas actiniarum]WDD98793.1 aspartate aminotransferase family protein [Thalassomonas actiniarum]
MTTNIEQFNAHAPNSWQQEFIGKVVIKAKNATLTYQDGSEAIDLASGGFGHQQADITQAVKKQVALMPLSNRVMISPTLAEFVKTLDQATPAPLSVSYICNSGEEAFDGSLKLAKGLHRDRFKVVVVRGSDFGSLSFASLFKEINAPTLAHLPLKPVFVEANDEEMLLRAIDDETLAVVYEPVLVGDDITVLSADYLTCMRELCHQSQAIMIAYEVNSGMGRFGVDFASELSGIAPDTLVLGGALNGGCVPVGAYVTRKAINDAVYGDKNPSLHGSTTGGNPASCVAGQKAVEVLQSKKLSARQSTLGQRFSQELMCRDKVEVKHLGSLVLLNFANHKLADSFRQQAVAAGINIARGKENTLTLKAPLTITDREVDTAIATLNQVALNLFENKEIA